MKQARFLISALLIAVLVAGVLPGAVNAQGPKPDATTLVVGQSVDVAGFEPHLANSRAEANVLNHIFGTLTKVEDDGKITPYLSESWTVSEDGKQINFTLRDGLTCHDGEALTAEDVAYTFERASNPDNKFTGNIQFVFQSAGYAGVKAEGEKNVIIELKDWSPIAIGLLAEVFIHCKDSYSQKSLEDAVKSPIGSGPYRLVEQKKDDYVLVEKVPTFKVFDVAFDKIYFRVIPEASTRVAELLAGNVDIVTNVPVDQVAAVNASEGAKVQAVAGTRRIYVGFSQRTDKFNTTEGEQAIKKAPVRVALQYAIDVPTICEALLGTACERANGLVNPPNNNASLTPYPYDPAKAEELLDAAGYPRKADGTRFEITLQGPRGRYLNDANVVQAIGEYLNAVGVKTTVEIIDWAQYRTTLPTHDAGPLFFLGTGGSTWSAWYDMADISQPKGATNYTEWDGMGGKWFELLAQSKLPENRSEEKQRAIIDEMLKLFYDDAPWLFLYFQPDFYGVSNRVDWNARRDEKVFAWQAKLK